MKQFGSICMIVIILTACVSADDTDGRLAGVAIEASAADFQVLEGTWDGELEYLDYGSEQRSTIPVGMTLTIRSPRVVEYAIRYPGEAQYNSKERLRLAADGSKIDGADLVSRRNDVGGALVLTTRTQGRDDNRPADVEMVYVIAADSFRIHKNIRFSPQGAFFNRNEYRFSRQHAESPSMR